MTTATSYQPTTPHLRVVGSPDAVTRADTVADLAGTYGRMTEDLAAMIDAEAERSAHTSALLQTALRELREALEALARGEVPL